MRCRHPRAHTKRETYADLSDVLLLVRCGAVRCSYYLATIAVGNPAQDLSVILDTGSSWLGIANSSCSPSSGCPAGTRLYNSSASRTYIPGTFVNEKTLQYGIGSTSGLVCREQVSFAGFTVANVTFLQAGSFSPSFGLTKRQSGIMGLGLPPLSDEVVPSWLDVRELPPPLFFPFLAVFFLRN